MKALKKIGFLLFFSSLLSSCVIVNHEAIYDPALPPMPLHQQKGEVTGTLAYGGYTGIHGNASVAFADNWAISAAGSYNPQQWKTPDLGLFGHYKVKHNSNGLETSLGYFSSAPNFFGNAFEVFGGFGLGQLDRKDYHTTENFYLLKGDYRHVFLQANIGQVNKKMEYGFGMRFSRVSNPPLFRHTVLQYAGLFRKLK